MSTVIDEKVVSMQFDNRNFEKGAATTLSTLDKLKQSLNFTGATKGLENVGSAAKNVNLSPLAEGIVTVQTKFSALEVMAVTALANITNSAVNAGKELVKSLSVDQITAGWSKYEQKTASVQTIMNATGKSIDDVNGYLDKLMWFSDETSYGFTDMTSALGQLTSAGGDIDKLIPLIMGVANATAYAGKGATEFSRAMYNLNQSYSSGSLQYTDWRSLELSGVASKELKQIFIDTGVALGKIKEGDVTIANFSQTLKDRWADTSVMEAAFGKFSELTEEAYKLVDAGQAKTAAEAIDMLSGKYSDVAEKAFRSAQEAKSFTEAIEATKDAVSSGWMKTFEIIFGNYEEAKILWTDLCDSLWDIFASSAEGRNNLLESALGSKWSQLSKQVENAGISIDEFKIKLVETGIECGAVTDEMIESAGGFEKSLSKGWVTTDIFVKTLKKYTGEMSKGTDATSDMNEKLKYFQDVVKKVWKGDFGNGAERVRKLTEAGYDYAVVQDLVNKTISDHTVKLEDLTDEQLKHIGYTDDEVDAIRELAKEAEKAGTPLSELIASLDKPSGRELLIESFFNVLNSLVSVMDAVKKAWTDIFPPATSEQIYGIAEGINALSLKLVATETTLDKITRTFRGLFAILDIIWMIITTSVNTALDLLGATVGKLDLDILGMTASVGDSIVKFRDWLKTNNAIQTTLDKIIELLKFGVGKIREWIDAFKELPFVESVIQRVSDAFDKLKNTFQNGEFTGTSIIDGLVTGLKDGIPRVWETIKEVCTNLLTAFRKVLDINSPCGKTIQIAGYIIAGLVNGLKDGKFSIKAIIKELANLLINTMCSALGIESPSTEFLAIGAFLIAGLILGVLAKETDLFATIKKVALDIIDKIKEHLKIGKSSGGTKEIGEKSMEDFAEGVENKASTVWEKIKEFGATLVEMFKKYAGPAALIGAGIGIMLLAKSLATAFNTITNPLVAFTGMMKNIGGAFKALEASFKANTLIKTSIAVFLLAGAIAVMAGAVAILANIDDHGKLWSAVGAIATLTVVASGLAIAVGALSKGGTGTTGAGTILILAGAVLILVVALKTLSSLDAAAVWDNLDVIGMISLALVALTVIMSKFAPQLSKGSLLLVSYAAALWIVVQALKSLADVGDISGAVDSLLAMMLGLAAVAIACSGVGAGAALTVIAIVIALKLMVSAIAEIAKVDMSSITKNIWAFVSVFGTLMGLLLIAGFAGDNVAKAGVAMVLMTASLLIIAQAIKAIGSIDATMIEQAMSVILSVLVMFAIVTAATAIAGENAAKAGVSILLMSGAMLILVGAMALIGKMDPGEIEQGMNVIMTLLGMMGVLVLTTGVVKPESMKTIISLTVAIGLLVGALIALSFVDSGKLGSATAALGVVMASLAVVVAMASKMRNNMKALLGLAAVLAVLSAALILLGYLPVKNSLAAGIALSAVLLSFSIAMKNLKGVTKKTLEQATILTAVIAGLTVAMALLALTGGGNAIGAAAALAIVLASIVGVTAHIKKLDKKTLESTNILIAMTSLLSVAMAILASNPWGQSIAAAASLAIVLASIVGTTMYVKKLDKKTLESTEILVALTSLLSVALAILASQPWGQSLAAAAAVAIVLGSIVAATMLVKAVDKKTIESMSILAAVTAVIAIALSALAGLPWQQTLVAATTLAVIILSLAASMALLSKTGPSMLSAAASLVVASASFILIATAISILTPALVELGSMSLASIGKALLAMAGAFAVIGVAGLLLGPITPLIIALAVAVAAVGVAFLAAGAGIMSLAAGLTMLTALGPEAITMFTNVVLALVALIPVLVAAVVNALVLIAQLIAAAAPKFVAAVVTVLTAMLVGIGTLIPLFLETMGVLITSLLEFLVSTIPQMVDAGLQIITGILTGIADNIQGIVEAGGDIIINFINGVGAKIPGVIDAAFKLVISFINGLADAIRGNRKALDDACKNLINAIAEGLKEKFDKIKAKGKEILDKLKAGITEKIKSLKTVGKDLINGLITGIEDMFSDVVKTIKKLGTKIVTTLKNLLGIKSPSRVFAEVGRFIDEGLIVGIEKYAGGVADATAQMGEDAVTAMTDVVGQISDAINSDIDNQPTIRPVLDLSDVESGSKRLNTLFSSNRALDVSASMNSAADSKNQNGVNAASTGNTYQFTQNNYSPKALSSIEIYRQTKNQFSTMERMATV